MGIGPYYRIYIYYDKLSSTNDSMKFNMIDQNGHILFQNSYRIFGHEEGKKLFAGSMTDINSLYDLDHINFTNE